MLCPLLALARQFTWHTPTIKLARAIGYLVESEEIQSAHLAEELQYSPKIMIG